MPRLLVIKMGAIGDVIMALPGVEAMHRAGYQVDWVAGRAIAPLLRLFPWIHVIEADDATIFSGSVPARLRAIVKLWRSLPTRHYDVCSTLYYDSRYKVLAAPVRAGRKFTLSHTDRAFRLLPSRHHTTEYARILLAGLPTNLQDANSPHQPAPLPLSSLLPPNPVPLTQGKQRIAIIPAGARNTRRAA